MEKPFSQLLTEKTKEAKWYSVPSVVELIQEVENLKKIIDLAIENISEENLDEQTIDELAIELLIDAVQKIQTRITGSYEQSGQDGLQSHLQSARFRAILEREGAL